MEITANSELVDELGSIIDEKIESIAEQLIDENPDDYYLGEESLGWYHNGVGMASYGSHKAYDEDKAFEDAKEKLAEDTANGGEDYELLFDDKIMTVLAKFISSR